MKLPHVTGDELARLRGAAQPLHVRRRRAECPCPRRVRLTAGALLSDQAAADGIAVTFFAPGA
jgi:hypothetical protein